MCCAIKYNHSDQYTRVYYSNREAALPVKTQTGDTTLFVSWGRRSSEVGVLPLGGWAWLDSIHRGEWDRWFGKPVKLAVTSFAARNKSGHAEWFPLSKGYHVQGLLASNGKELRAYVVIVNPETDDVLHHRWPRIVSGDTWTSFR